MCGICGIIKFDNSASETEMLQKMMKVMKHRGPDDEGIFTEASAGLGFVRLSIIDLSSAGHQPMFSSEKVTSTGVIRRGRYVIVYNGEVYNYIELRAVLNSKGYQFISNTDTEVVLNSFIEWGESCLDKFNGMWAFAIYDRERKELFCARDRYGIKPFYYYTDNEQFTFASEIPPLLSIMKRKPIQNNQAIFDYLVFNRTDQTEETFFEEVKKLQHGHMLTFKNSELKIKKWYNLRERVNNAEGFRNAEEYREVFSSAVGLRLRSDVPVGVCLSGGLDSSSLVSVLLKDYDKKDLNTFSAVYSKGQYGDESEFINLFRHPGLTEGNSLQNMFYTTPTAETLYTDLNNFVGAHAEPIPSTSPYAQFKVMELAKGNVVVTLDGQGADEELAGYHYFFGFYFKD
jgi:asparagine synthase (glutamine-hydrolysing)